MTTDPTPLQERIARAIASADGVGGPDGAFLYSHYAAAVLPIIAAEVQAAAEHRATRAEAQSAIRGRAVVIYQGRAREAEARLAGWMEHWNATARTGAVDEVAAILEANARADEAEARIKAVRELHCSDGHDPDVCGEPGCFASCTEDSMEWPCDTIRALDGTVTPPRA